MKIPSLREQFQDEHYTTLINFAELKNVKNINDLFRTQFSVVELFNTFLCNPTITNIKDFRQITTNLKLSFQLIFPDFNIQDRQIYVGKNVLLTQDLFDLINYVYKTALGYHVEQEPHFGPDEQEAKAFYERQKLMEDKIEEIRNANSSKDKDALLDVFTLICYKFNYTFEQLYDMTMGQLGYLQKISSRIISYEDAMKAYTAGNLKKAPEFFIKK